MTARFALVRSVHSILRSASPCLRVIALAYAGIGGAAMLGVVASLAVLPRVPIH